MDAEINLGVISKYFGVGRTAFGKGSIKFWVGANYEYGEDTDIYLCPEDFEKIEEDARRIAQELRDLQKGGE